MEPWLVVGLGNPGPDYAKNRHNVGAMVVRELADRAEASLRSTTTRSGRAWVALTAGSQPVVAADGAPGAPGARLVLGQPQSFMNDCGPVVSALSSFYKVPVERLIVVHDDLDIPFGDVRLKRGGGEGGHNGLRSVTRSVGTREYFRVRVGIGRPPGRTDPADFVLRNFTAAEAPDVVLLVSGAADAVQLLASAGLVAAQQRHHRP